MKKQNLIIIGIFIIVVFGFYLISCNNDEKPTVIGMCSETDYVKVKVIPMHGGEGYVCPIDLPAYQAAEKAVEIAFGQTPLAVRRGGSIPIISTFEQVLGIKTVLMGFGLEQNAIHSPNESCRLDIIYKGIESVAEFYRIFKS